MVSKREKKAFLDKIFKEENGNEFDTSHLSQDELIKRIRKIRNKIWDERHKEWFE